MISRRFINFTLGFRNLILQRNLSTDSSLAKLRKKTGYAFSLCRKALELHNEDIDKAESWLNAEAMKQGWQKADMIKNKPVNEGLIGVFAAPDSSLATLIEVNCETDFVARNDMFRKLVSELTRQVAQRQIGDQHNDNGNLSKLYLSPDELDQIGREDIVKAIGKLGENIKLLRGLLVVNNKKDENIHLIGYTHAVGGKIQPDQYNVMLGKYGAIIALEPNPPRQDVEGDQMKNRDELTQIGKQLAQHIIGMNPLTIEPKNEIVESEPTALLQQQFIFDDELTVSDFLRDENVKIIDFVRVECGVYN